MNKISCKDLTLAIGRVKSDLSRLNSLVEMREYNDAQDMQFHIQTEIDELKERLPVEWEKIEQIKTYQLDAAVWDAIESADEKTLTAVTSKYVKVGTGGDIIQGIKIINKKSREIIDSLDNMHIEVQDNLVESADGKTIIFIDRTRKIHFFEKETTAHHTIQIFSDLETPLMPTRDGQHVLTGSGKGLVRLWNIETKEVDTYECRRDDREIGTSSIAESQDGTQIIVGCDEGSILVFDKETGAEVFRNGIGITVHPPILDTKDGKKIIATAGGQKIMMWDKESGEMEGGYIVDTNVHKIIESDDGKYLIAGGQSGKIIIFNQETGTKISDIKVAAGMINDLQQIDDDLALAASDDHTAIIFRISTGELIKRLKGHNDTVHKAILSRDKRRIITCSSDQTIAVWGIPTPLDMKSSNGEKEEDE